MSELYISVRNWRKFQHYDPAKRQPPWIKNYTELLSRDDYLNLSPGRRALLHGLWIVYALACTCPRDRDDLRCTCLRLDVKLLNRRLGLNAKMSDYESLNHAGFILLVASGSLAPRYQSASPEVEVEEETPISPYSDLVDNSTSSSNGMGRVFVIPDNVLRAVE